MKVFSSAFLGVSSLSLYFFLKRRGKNVRFEKLTLLNFNRASPEEKRQFFDQWCQHNPTPPRRHEPEELDEYALIFKLPTFNDWKEIHGHARPDLGVSRDFYIDWVKYIGAYNSKFDIEHPEWNGSLKDSF